MSPHACKRQNYSGNTSWISFVLVADYRKNSTILGTTVSSSTCSASTVLDSVIHEQFPQGIPIEVVPFAYTKILQNLHLIGSPNASLRMAKAKAGPVVTDNGNFIIDAPFPPEIMSDPYTVRASGFIEKHIGN